MYQHQLNIMDFWSGLEILLNRIAKNLLPNSIEEKIRQSTAGIQKEIVSIEVEITKVEPTLKDTVEVIKGKIHHQMRNMGCFVRGN